MTAPVGHTRITPPRQGYLPFDLALAPDHLRNALHSRCSGWHEPSLAYPLAVDPSSLRRKWRK